MALHAVRRSWVSFELPGFREPPGGYATYSDFSYEELPPIEDDLDDGLRWLTEKPRRQELARRAGFGPCESRDRGGARPVGFGALDHGLLVHFLSDSQWVCHWLLYSGPDGEAVVASYDPLGFELGEDEVTLRELSSATMDASVCAESFSEFLYRFWIENEIWFELAAPGLLRRPKLTDEQPRYVEHYAT
jgi:hypothetical protein